MPKRKEPEIESPETWKDAETIQTIDPEDEGLEEALRELPQGESCLQIFRIKEQGGRPLYLEAIPPSTFNLEYISSRFGGGRYMVRAKFADGRVKKIPLEIEGEAIPVRRLGKGYGAEPAPELMQAIRSALPQQPQTEYVETEGESGVVQLALAIIKNQQNQGNNRAEIIAEMKAMRELFAPATQTPIEQMLGMFEKGLNAAGGGKSDNIWLELAREFKEPLKGAVDAVQMAIAAKQSQPAAPVAPVQPGAAEVVPPGVQINEENMGMMLINSLKPLMVPLSRAAEKGADPNTYVGMLLDQLDENLYPTFQQFLLRPDCLDILATQIPNVRRFPGWFVQLRKLLLEELAECLKPDDDDSLQSPTHTNPTT